MLTPGRWLGLKTVIRCADFERSRDFYARVLGLRVVEEWDEPQGRGCIFSRFESGREPCIEIYQMTRDDRRFEESFLRPVESDKIDLQLRTGSVDFWAERLRGGWDFEGPEILPWGHRWIRLRDPDRLLIAIYEEK
jgi:catechol 2,3-dioxygenase-like lactoylglutathione lyase family enzyme